MTADQLDPLEEKAFDEGCLFPGRDDEGGVMNEDTLHEHRCEDCGRVWSCRRVDCTPWDNVCRECEGRARDEWAEAHDPQPELPLVCEGVR